MNNYTLVNVFEDSYNLLLDPNHWTQRSFARKSDKVTPVTHNDREASCWCSVGAIYKFTRQNIDSVSGDKFIANAIEILDSISKDLGYPHIMMLNDTADHNTVLNVFLKAIEKVKV